MKNPHTGTRRLWAAGGFSVKGLKAAYQHEAAFRQEVWLSLVLIPLALIIGESPMERVLLVCTLLVLLVVELLNSAIETVVDRVGSEFNELSGRAKDMGSAAVLITVMAMAMVWLVALLT